MSTLKVGGIRGVSASSDAITVANDGTATGKFTNIPLKNLFLNPALLISQRGDSYSSANAYTADQWYVFVTGVTAERLTTSPPAGFTHYIRFPSATSSPIMTQQIELDLQGKAGRFAGKTVTVSWYARSESNNTMYVDAAFKNASGGGDYTAIASGSSSAQQITSSWARYTQTFTISVDPHANNKCFSIMIRTPSGQGGTLELTGFQAEFGSVATDFEYRPISQELALCERYFQKDISDRAFVGFGNVANRQVMVRFTTEMRDTPTVTFSNTQIDGGGSLSASNLSRQGYNCEMSSTGRLYVWRHTATAEL
tara:strand:+ start:897 stop:1829 length:933 start_codon:yes stop_codon:yes gene_type:complete